MPELVDRLKAALADHYAIERQIGEGAMATVYLARDLRHDRNVAVKLLRPELAASIGSDRFLREIAIAAKLQHPHILPLYESGQAGTFLFYVMPFVVGESLRDRLDREGLLPVPDALQIARQVAGALGYAHSLGFVHRDIKPANIMLHHGQAVVVDFGIARAVTAAGGQRLTSTGLAVGTPSYMSPEQASGDQNLDGRSDIYSLACVLYEALIGHPPFEGPSGPAIMALHATAPVPPVRPLRPAVTDYAERAITKALAKLPADRYPTATEFAERLASRATAPVTSPRPEQHPAQRWWRYGAVAGLVAAGLGVAGVWYWRLGPDPVDSIDPGPPRTVTYEGAVQVNAARQMILEVKARARTADAPALADSTYQLALQAEQTGELRLAAGDSVAALDALDEAIDLFRRSYEIASRGSVVAATRDPAPSPPGARVSSAPRSDSAAAAENATAQKAAAAETARTTMVAAKANVLGEDDDTKSTNPQYERGLRLEEAGFRQLRSGAVDSARLSFDEAADLFDRAATEIAAELRREADAAKQSMTDAKARLPGGSDTTTAYREAGTVKAAADSAYQAARYDAAVTYYHTARDQYLALASRVPDPVESTRQAIVRLIEQYEEHVEARDLQALRTLFADFDENQWAAFFELATGIEVEIDVEHIDVQDPSASVDLSVDITYRNNENRETRSSQRYSWIIGTVDGRPVIERIVSRP